MQELQDKVAELLGQSIASGELDAAIKRKLDKTIDDILDDMLRSYSPFGKSLRAQLEKTLSVDMDLGIGGYNVLVADIVARRLAEAIQGEWAADLAKRLDEVLRAAPKTIKLSELLVKLAEGHEDTARDGRWSHATMLIERTEYGSRWVYLDPEPRNEREKYRFKWRLLVHDDGEISRVSGDDAEGSKRTLLAGRRYGMEGLLFQLHAGKTRLELDRDPGLHEHEYDHEGQD
jgi:hypothetical protein